VTDNTHHQDSTHHHGSAGSREGEDFTTSEGLRALLVRLHHAGPGAWEHDQTAGALMVFAAEKYAPLARKHGLDPWEAASAAFDVMRSESARTAVDPWAVITRGVHVTCIFEERGQGLLCSVHQARRPHVSVFHDPERFGDRENPLTDYHPAFQTTDTATDSTRGMGVTGVVATSEVDSPAARKASRVVEDAIALFTLLDWPAETARAAVEYVCAALARAGTRQSAYESLRRDKHARALLDLPGASWRALLKVLLGNPHPAYAATATGRGVLLRLLFEETVPALMRDDDLILTIFVAAPEHHGHGSGRGSAYGSR